MANPISGESADVAVPAVSGVHTGGGAAVNGVGNPGSGIRGVSTDGRGMEGWSVNAYGVSGDSQNSAGVRGTSLAGRGTEGWSTNGEGVFGISTHGAGVAGTSTTSTGVFGTSQTGEGIHAETSSPNYAAFAAVNLNPDGIGAAIYGEKRGGSGHAGFFVGNVHVTGAISTDQDILLTNADCAEEFDVSGAEAVEPGTVMVLEDEGGLRMSDRPYDKRVAGVISGAGDFRPAIVLDKRPTHGNRQPIALLGKTYCRVDARFGAIEVGDMLTTSATPGHAMKASEPGQAFGAVIGKALRPLPTGQGLIPILIALQ